MRNGRLVGVAGVVAFLVAGTPALAQASGAPAAGPMLPAAVLEPEAEAALNRMGAALRALGSFEVRSDATAETVYEGNHKIMSSQQTTYTVARPDRMLVDMVGDSSHRRFYYNGKVMTVVGMKIGKYVTFPLTGTINEVLSTAYDQFGISFPLQDLFRWGDPSSDVVRPSSGFRVGESMVGSVKTIQYAFRQEGVDFQIWIEDGVQALPRKMVITSLDHPAQPQYAATFTWNRTPKVTPATFSFTPRAGDQLIDFGTAKASVAATDGK